MAVRVADLMLWGVIYVYIETQAGKDSWFLMHIIY